MKDCYGTYEYKGWFIFFSEGSQLWEIQPTKKVVNKITMNVLSEEECVSIREEWYSEWFNKDLNTLSKTKKYIKENEGKLMSDLKVLLSNLDLC